MAKLKGSRYQTAEQSPGYLLWKTFYAWQRQMRMHLDPLKITQVQYSILATLSYLSSSGEPISQQAIANQLSMDKMMVSDVVKTLEKKKFLVRDKNPMDARASSLHLTSMARKILEKATPVVEDADEVFFGKLEKTERLKIIEIFQKLHSDEQTGNRNSKVN